MSAGALLARVGAAGVLLAAPCLSGPAPHGGDLQAAEARYWPAADLDVRPQVMTRVMPQYPAELVSGIRGRVVLELYIAADGKLDRIRVASAQPPGRFEESARKAFGAARYSPGIRKGKPVASLMRIEVTFGY